MNDTNNVKSFMFVYQLVMIVYIIFILFPESIGFIGGSEGVALEQPVNKGFDRVVKRRQIYYIYCYR